MKIKFLIGLKTKKLFNDQINMQKMFSQLNGTDRKFEDEYLNDKYTSDLMYIVDSNLYVNLEIFLKKFKKMTDFNKIFHILKYAEKNDVEKLYLYLDTIDEHFIKNFLFYTKDDITFLMEKEDKNIVDKYKDIHFEIFKQGETIL